jgi:polysaccharide pyruvyl transferase WcaK-like protein
MKAFFVGDNRTNVNWGRAASIALRELLSREFEICGCVTGDFFDLSIAQAGLVGTLTPARFYGLVRRAWRDRTRPPFSWWMRLERLYGAKDFIAEEPAESVDNLIAHKQKYWSLTQIYQQASEADVVIVDGDGDIVFSTPPRRQTLFLLAMIELGLRLKKPVFLVNSMISDCATSGRNLKTMATMRALLERCEGAFLRDAESYEYVRTEMPAVKAQLIPDSLFAWLPRFASPNSHPPADGDFILPYPESEEYWGKLDFSKPYICIGGGALAGSNPDRAAQTYGKLVDAILQLGLQVCLTENDTPDSFLRRIAKDKGIGLVPVNTPIVAAAAVLAHARLFISGRYHPSIMASLGGTPCIFLGSHAHKMESLARLLEYGDRGQFGGFPSDQEIAAIVSLAEDYLAQGESLRERIRRVAQFHCAEVSKLPARLKQALVGAHA